MTGSGTVADPYVIYDVTDLQNMNLDLTAYYELANDIDASATVGWNGGEGFIPIGSRSTEFFGHLDGKGYKISDITINRPTSLELQALIGWAAPASGYIVQNLTLEGGSITGGSGEPFYSHGCASLVGEIWATGSDCYITNCHSSADVDGQMFVGGLIGRIYKWAYTEGITVSECSFTGSVNSRHIPPATVVGGFIAAASSSTITNCYSTANVTTTDSADTVGGFVGSINDCTVTECYATGTVSGGDDYVGGFAGRFWGDVISGCYATGNVTANATSSDGVGGFLGCVSELGCQKCYATGDVFGYQSVGGFMGRGTDPLSDCYARGAVTGDRRVGGFAGQTTDVIDNCYSTGLVNGTTDEGGFIGRNYGTITDCFWDTETSGQAASDGGTGKTTVQMKIKTTFMGAGWNFKTIWNILATVNDSYPAFIVVVTRIKGNPIVDQRMFQHVERMGR